VKVEGEFPVPGKVEGEFPRAGAVEGSRPKAGQYVTAEAPPAKPPKPPEAPPAAVPAPEPGPSGSGVPVETVKAAAETAEAQLATAPSRAERAEDLEKRLKKAEQTIDRLKAIRAQATSKAAVAAVDDLKKRFVAIAKEALPLNERGKLLSRVRTVKTTQQLTQALEQVEKYLEETLKSRAIKRYKKFANLIEQNRRKIEPGIYSLAQQALMARPTGGRYSATSLETIEALADRLEQVWHWHETSEYMGGVEKAVKIQTVAGDILRELAESRKPMARRVGIGGQSIAPDESTTRWLAREGIQSIDTLLEGLGLPVDGPTYQQFVYKIGVVASEAYYQRVNDAYAALDRAIGQQLPFKRHSRKFEDWTQEGLTFDFPFAGKHSAPRDFWMDLRNTFKDSKSLAQILEENAGIVWSSDLRMDPIHMTLLDAEWFLSEFAKRESAADAVSQAAKDYFARIEYRDELSEKNHELFGLYLETADDYWPRQRNVKTEGRTSIEGFLEGQGIDPTIVQPGHWKERTGTKASLIIGSMMDRFTTVNHENASRLAYGTEMLNNLKLLKAPIEQGGKRLSLKAWIQEYQGTSFGNALTGSMRHIMTRRALAPTRYGTGKPTGLIRRVANATRRALLSFNAPAWLSQLPSGLLGASDTVRPLSMADTLYGMRKAFSGEFAGLADLLEAHSATLKNRWSEAVPESIVGSHPEAQALAHSAAWRRVRQVVNLGLKPFIRLDRRAIVGMFAGKLRAVLRARKIAVRGSLMDTLNGLDAETRKAVVAAAVDDIHWLVPRTQPNLDPAYDSGIGREASESLAVGLLTFFSNQRNRNVNIFVRLIDQFRRTHNWAALLKGLVPLAIVTALFVAKSRVQQTLGGGQPASGGIGGDIAENALGNLYGVGEVVHALRARSGYDAEIRGVPVIQGPNYTIKGIVEMRRALTDGPKTRGKAARAGTKNLVRGIGMMLGVPTPVLFNMVRYLGGAADLASDATGDKAEKVPGRSLLVLASGENEGAALRAVAKLKADGKTLAQARIELRRQLIQNKASVQERVERLRRLSARWRAAAVAA